jgi:hypothetical protein
MVSGFAEATESRRGARDIELMGGVAAVSVRGGRGTSTMLPVVRAPRPLAVRGVSRPIEVKFASTESEWEQAFRLAASSYQARGYEVPGANRLRFTPYHALPDTITLVAKHYDEVVATFSVVMDNLVLGLPMEDVYPEEIDRLRRQGRRLAETTTLADAGLNVRDFIQVFLSLIKLGMQHHRSHGGDTPVIVVNPRHRQFYTKMLGFVGMGSLRSYAAVQDHPAEAFWVDYDLLKARAPKMYEDIFGTTLPREALYAPRMPQHLIRKFAAQSSLCDSEQIDQLLAFREKYRSVRRW